MYFKIPLGIRLPYLKFWVVYALVTYVQSLFFVIEVIIWMVLIRLAYIQLPPKLGQYRSEVENNPETYFFVYTHNN